jgi:hypothetical protein
MGKLFDLERVVVDHPGPAQVAPDRLRADVVGRQAAEVAVVAAQQEIKADDLECRQGEAGLW